MTYVYMYISLVLIFIIIYYINVCLGPISKSLEYSLDKENTLHWSTLISKDIAPVVYLKKLTPQRYKGRKIAGDYRIYLYIQVYVYKYMCICKYVYIYIWMPIIQKSTSQC